MNARIFVCALALLALSRLSASAADTGIRDELAAIIGSVREKTARNMTTAEELAPEAKRFDELVAKHAGEKGDDFAEALQSQANFYLRVIKDPARAMTIAERIKKEMPDTPSGKRIDNFIASVNQAPPPPSGIEAETAAIKTKIEVKLRAGKNEESDFTAELAQFDALYSAHKSEKTDAVANILLLKSSFYAQVLRMPEKALAIASELKANFAGTKSADQADSLIAAVTKQAAAAKIQEALGVGSAFPDFAELDTTGKPLSIARFKGTGKVILVDFWAMWCGPCLAELPNVVATYATYHPAGFEIVGVSLDTENDGPKLAEFTKSHNMPWPQYFDGKYWTTKLAQQYGIMSIPATFLLDGEGKIIGRDLRGPDLEAAVRKALGK